MPSPGPSPTPSPGPAPAPPQPFVALMGVWRGHGGTEIRNNDNGVLNSYACSQNWSIAEQNGGQFSGWMESTGQGSNSDKFCTVGGTKFNAVMTAGGAITSLRLEHGIGAVGCTRVSGDGVYTGTVIDENNFRVEMTDQLTCTDPVGKSYPATRTITVTATRR